MKLKEIAELVGGRVIGDPDMEITGVSGISDAKTGDITYLSGTKLLKELNHGPASAVLVAGPVDGLEKAQVSVKNPQYAFAELLARFYVKPHPFRGVDERAFVSQNAAVGGGVTIYPFSYISDGVKIGSGSVIFSGVFIGESSSIGEGCTIYPNVTIRDGVSIGNRVVIHPGSVIGADGFRYIFEGGMHRKIPQVGGVIVEDDVEIGANVTIDRAMTGNTVVGRGTKIDNLVQIGHNVKVGNNVILVSQVGIAGSSEIGDGVILGGQVGVADHARIEAGTMISAQSGVMPGETRRGIYSGSPMMQHREWLKSSAFFARLPEMNKRIKELEEKIKSLEGK